jgi:hypothetical protein
MSRKIIQRAALVPIAFILSFALAEIAIHTLGSYAEDGQFRFVRRPICPFVATLMGLMVLFNEQIIVFYETEVVFSP